MFDPDHPEANLVWRNGKVIDLDKDDNNKLEAECAENKTFFHLFYGTRNKEEDIKDEDTTMV